MKTLHLKPNLIGLLATAALLSFTACVDPDPEPPEGPIVGQIGNPQFNLQFTNPEGVDLDLYVEDPAGNIIYYSNPTSNTGGELDIDCLCSYCPNGPNENIFWPLDGSAPEGIYKYWVNYYSACNESNASSSYTVRVLKNGSVVETKTGTLTSGRSNVWIYEQN